MSARASSAWARSALALVAGGPGLVDGRRGVGAGSGELAQLREGAGAAREEARGAAGRAGRPAGGGPRRRGARRPSTARPDRRGRPPARASGGPARGRRPTRRSRAQLGGQLGRPHVVVRDAVEHGVLVGILVDLHPRGDAGVGLRTVGLRERAVGDLAHHVGAERPLLAPRRCRSGGAAPWPRATRAPGARRRCRGASRPSPRWPAPGHGGRARRSRRGRGARRAVRPSRRAATRPRSVSGSSVTLRMAADHPGLAEQGDELLQEERVAAAALEQRGGQASRRAPAPASSHSSARPTTSGRGGRA